MYTGIIRIRGVYLCKKSAENSRNSCIEVQSNTALLQYLEEHYELWLEIFQQELEDMPVEKLEIEASAVIFQLFEYDTKLSQRNKNIILTSIMTQSFFYFIFSIFSFCFLL
jgi:secreted Zn-dependent insulinase-like peptidase